MEFDEVRSKCAITHRFKRLRTPAKCRQCDTYVYFNGYECEVVSVWEVVSRGGRWYLGEGGGI